MEKYRVVADRLRGMDALGVSVYKYVWDPERVEDAKSFTLSFASDGKPVWTEYQPFEVLNPSLVLDRQLEAALTSDLVHVIEDANRESYDSTCRIMDRLRRIVAVWDSVA